MTPARRRPRRQRLLLAGALVLTAVVVVVGHDVRTLAARSTANRASLNEGFAALAQSSLLNERSLASDAGRLLAHGGQLSRVAFGGRLALDFTDASTVRQMVAIVATPVVDDNAQAHLIRVVDGRVTAIEELLAQAARELQLPHPAEPWPGVAAVQSELVATNQLWAATRAAFARDPGRVHLARSVCQLATEPLAAELAALGSSPALAPVREVAIAAVEVTPAPFPAPAGHLVLPPVSSVVVNVAVRNLEFINQPFSVTLTLRRGAGPVHTAAVSVRLGPLASRAIAFAPLSVTPGELATLTVAISGAPTPPGADGSRTYAVRVAPSPSG